MAFATVLAGMKAHDIHETFLAALDLGVLVDRMLDAFNRYLETGDDAELEEARKFAALVQMDSLKFPALYAPQALAQSH